MLLRESVVDRGGRRLLEQAINEQRDEREDRQDGETPERERGTRHGAVQEPLVAIGGLIVTGALKS